MKIEKKIVKYSVRKPEEIAAASAAQAEKAREAKTAKVIRMTPASGDAGRLHLQDQDAGL